MKNDPPIVRDLAKKSLFTLILTCIGAVTLFAAEAIFEPEIQLLAQEKRCDWVFDCDKHAASAFVKSLRIGLDIRNLKSSTQIPHLVGKKDEYKLHTFCNSSIYAEVFLTKDFTIEGYIIVSKNDDFTPKIPGTEFRIGEKIVNFKSDKFGIETIGLNGYSYISRFRGRSTYFVKEVVEASKISGWRQVVVGYLPQGINFNSQNAELFSRLVPNSDMDVVTIDQLNNGLDLQANMYAVAKGNLLTKHDSMFPEFLVPEDFSDFDCE